MLVEEHSLVSRFEIVCDGLKQSHFVCPGEQGPLKPNTETKQLESLRGKVWGPPGVLFNTAVPSLYFKARNENEAEEWASKVTGLPPSNRPFTMPAPLLQF